MKHLTFITLFVLMVHSTIVYGQNKEVEIQKTIALLKKNYPDYQRLFYEDKYEDTLGGFFYIQINDKWGIINNKGKVLIEPNKYDKMEYGKDSYFIVTVGGKFGVCGIDGIELVPCKYYDIRLQDNGVKAKLTPDGTNYYPIDCNYVPLLPNSNIKNNTSENINTHTKSNDKVNKTVS